MSTPVTRPKHEPAGTGRNGHVPLAPGTSVLITGASRGIGAALARAFAGRGCTVGLVARSADDLAATAETLPGQGHRVLPADVADPVALTAAVEAFGTCDVLVANAGISHYLAVSELGLDCVERMTAVNWLGTVYAVTAALPGMLDRGRGHIVIVSSAAALRAFPHAGAYGATKAAQRRFAEALYHELSGTGVSLTTVYPGEVDTRLHDHERARMPAWYRSGDARPPEALAERVLSAIERSARAVYYPSSVRLLRITDGLSPRVGDVMLRMLRGRAAIARTSSLPGRRRAVTTRHLPSVRPAAGNIGKIQSTDRLFARNLR